MNAVDGLGNGMATGLKYGVIPRSVSVTSAPRRREELRCCYCCGHADLRTKTEISLQASLYALDGSLTCLSETLRFTACFGSWGVIAFDFCAPFPAFASVYIWVYFVSAICISVQCPCARYSCNVKILKYQKHQNAEYGNDISY